MDLSVFVKDLSASLPFFDFGAGCEMPMPSQLLASSNLQTLN